MGDQVTRKHLKQKPFLPRQVEGRRILLHACCAPDATVPIGAWQALASDLAVYFYNPNIHPCEEYLRRLEGMRTVARQWSVPLIEGMYLPSHGEPSGGLFCCEKSLGKILRHTGIEIPALKGLPSDVRKLLRGGDADETLVKLRPFAEEPEGGKRCELCFALRLTRAAAMTRRLGFDALATTLTISPHKDTDSVNQIGAMAAQRLDVDYVWTNLKKQEGFKRSILESRRLGLYRQHYCGCVFSQASEVRQKD